MRKIAALLLLIFVPLAAQVTMEEVGALSDQMDKASDAFRSYKFEKSIDILNSLIATLDEWDKNGSLQESDEALYKKALEIRGVSYFHLGKDQNSKEDFTRLIRMDPDLNPEITSSSKIMRYYNTIRDSMAGSLVLLVSPPDASVTIDGKPYPGNRTIRLLEGLHVLKASAMGYNTFSKEIQVQAGKSVQETVNLRPNARRVYFFIKPGGAKLFVDGKFAGSADIPASRKAEWTQYVSGAGYDPSGYFAIEALYLPPGDHRIEIAAPCYSTRKFTIPVALDAVENKPGYIKPIELSKETLTLRITSHPGNALVEIDGSGFGTTPLELKNFCSGNHLVRVFKKGQGEYSQNVELKGTAPVELKARLRPTLLWLGSTRDQEVPPETFLAFEGSVKTSLPGISSFNIVFSKEENPFLPDTFFARGVSEAEQQSLAKELCAKYPAEGVLVSKLRSEGDKVMVALRLYVPGIERFDEPKSLLLDARDTSFLVKKFDAKKEPASTSPAFYDDGKGGLLVLRSGGCGASLMPGDRVMSINGNEVKTAREASDLLNVSDGAATVVLRRGPDNITETIGASPKVFLFRSGGQGCRKQWLLCNQEILSSEDALSLTAARLSLASVEIALGRTNAALELIDSAATTGEASCLDSTRKYIKAVALFHEGDATAAKAELSELLSLQGDIRLGSDGKVLLAPLAEDLMKMAENGERR